MAYSMVRIARFCILALTVVCLSCVSNLASAEDVISVSEHWELQVGGPDLGSSAPQVSMVMSPTANLACNYFIFSLNHWNYPDYQPGGTQVQRWHAEEPVATTYGSNENPLSHDNETISWVQTLSVDEGQLSFDITDGSSQSWGAFGGGEHLRLSHATSLVRLNDYRPAISIGESAISYAGNRVSALVLKKLEWTTSDGEVHEMIAPIDIDADLDP